MDTITIPKAEYQRLKKKAREATIDSAFVAKIKRALEDIKHGRITEWNEH